MTIKEIESKLNIIYNEDCLATMARMPDNFVDLVLTDIPYDNANRTVESGIRAMKKGDADVLKFNVDAFLEEVFRITKGSAYIFHGLNQLSEIYKFYLHNKGVSTKVIVWSKTNPSPVNGTKVFLNSIETAVWFKKPGAKFNAHCRGTIFNYPVGRSKLHPTEKPLGLFKELIEISTDKGDLVYDPCLGSGTTAVASKEAGRQYIASELLPEYFDVAVNRLKSIKYQGVLL